MVIAVASGKGGTGKTLVAVNLALALAREGREVQLIDCDVEEPNDHLFLTPEMYASRRVELTVPRVDHESCDLCRACVDFCAYHALALAGGRVMVFDELCHACGGCSLLCPQKAIREEPVPIGRIECGQVKAGEGGGKDIRFRHGILDIGEPKATPITRELKKELHGPAITILDGGPGTGCPVMETVRGCDYCVLMTEPTQFGLHDLRMALDMARELGVPYGVVINKYVLGGGGMDTWCAENGIPVLLRIPYKREYASLYSRGLNLVEELPAWGERFLRVYREIEASVGARKVGT
ncbi:MAG: ATP-binding protein [Actinobacteria bacterium]|nr:ATP-binding protein [Actinomycetota bacterium]